MKIVTVLEGSAPTVYVLCTLSSTALQLLTSFMISCRVISIQSQVYLSRLSPEDCFVSANCERASENKGKVEEEGERGKLPHVCSPSLPLHKQMKTV